LVGSESDSPPPSSLTIAGIREMGDNKDKAVKLQKFHKPRLIEAIVTCMGRIDLLEKLEDGYVRLELRKRKAAVFANATSTSNTVVTQDTQDCLDRPNIGWDAINKLAEEQNPASLTAVADTPSATAMVPPRRAAPGRATSQSWPSGSSWQGPRTCGACHPSPR
jgi:hypothetical protein